MTDQDLKALLYKASVHGLQGDLVIGFIQPQAATESSIPKLIIQKYVCQSATEEDLRSK